MFDREKMLKSVMNIDDRIFLSKIIDKAFKAYKAKEITHSDFLDPSQQGIVKKAMEMQDEVQFEFDGGYEGAERSVAFFYPLGDFYVEDESPITCLNATYKVDEKLSHRDFLGSLMGLGIKREKIGDILVREQGASIIVSKDIADYVLYNLVKVGRVKLSVEYIDLSALEVPEKEVKEIKTTVASLRLDCIISAGYGMSRSRVAELIRSERVNVNFEPASEISKLVKAGDVISVRGRGRMLFESEGGRTKKGRSSIILKRLV